jgi:hypothetical protein
LAVLQNNQLGKYSLTRRIPEILLEGSDVWATIEEAADLDDIQDILQTFVFSVLMQRINHVLLEVGCSRERERGGLYSLWDLSFLQFLPPFSSSSSSLSFNSSCGRLYFHALLGNGFSDSASSTPTPFT